MNHANLRPQLIPLLLLCLPSYDEPFECTSCMASMPGIHLWGTEVTISWGITFFYQTKALNAEEMGSKLRIIQGYNRVWDWGWVQSLNCWNQMRLKDSLQWSSGSVTKAEKISILCYFGSIPSLRPSKTEFHDICDLLKYLLRPNSSGHHSKILLMDQS